jgi:hypothetical protein
VQNTADRDNRLRNRQNALQRAVNDVKATHPGSPARAHVMEDAEKPRDSYVMVKGNPATAARSCCGSSRDSRGSPSQTIPRRQRTSRTRPSDRQQDNPLAPRVMANRIWLHHFGDGLVNTPDDFGLRSEAPTHPQLLDYLAARFMEEGWSLKKMHRLLMLSATWQQGSDENPRFAQIDPGNKYYWQMNRRRLDFEALRDTILYLGGRLDLTMGGPGVRLEAEPYPTRRTVYAFIDRARLPSMFQSFDFANPDLSTGKRSETIIPQQALFMMNSALVVEQARNLTLRPDFKAKGAAEEKIKLLYKLIYQRAPSDTELKLALEYIRGETGVTASNAGQLAWEYGYGEFNPAERRVEDFVQLTTFNGRAWVRAIVRTPAELGA